MVAERVANNVAENEIGVIYLADFAVTNDGYGAFGENVEAVDFPARTEVVDDGDGGGDDGDENEHRVTFVAEEKDEGGEGEVDEIENSQGVFFQDIGDFGDVFGDRIGLAVLSSDFDFATSEAGNHRFVLFSRAALRVIWSA